MLRTDVNKASEKIFFVMRGDKTKEVRVIMPISTLIGANANSCDDQAHFISKIANADSCDCLTGKERVFILKGDKVLEYSQKTGAITETDLRITKPDYEAIVKQIIDEKIFNEGFIPDKEYVLEMIRFLLDSDLIKFDFDISGIKIKPVMDFLVRLDDKEIIIRELIGKEDEDEDEDLDKATIYTCEIKKFLKSGCDSKKIIYLKTIVLITHLIMQKIDELGLDY